MYNARALSALHKAFETAAGGQQTAAPEVFNRAFTGALRKLSVHSGSSVK